ncbi:MAG: hypothetical protein IKY45_00090 [Clostridia bacterium]|nr:hypothetical protein [Clostridia bacterium]
MEKEITIYRVRKSPENFKTQKGAFFIFENAVKLAKRTRCNVYDNYKNCVWSYK